MASQCKRQQCSIDRRGFRQELDSWRHKLIHCVGFESILEGLFGTELVEDLQLFKDLEPVAVSDWSFDENCLFCCFRRDKVKEHLIGLSSDESRQDPLKPIEVKDWTTISKLERQAEEFLNAVLCNKDVPSFSDPHIPVVAREILQKMIRQFAAEYTSKTSSPQDSGSAPQPSSDQSPQTQVVTSGTPPSRAGPALSHNPVLSQLLMADQEAPLDLTIKKTPSEPSEQEGVLDLSIKKSCHSSNSLPVSSPRLSPKVSMIKGECQDIHIAKAKEIQSTSTLEQFMAKLCRHHQRTIVDAIGFLQTDVAASKTQQTSDSGVQGATCCTPKSDTVTPEKSCLELEFPSESRPKFQVLDMSCSIQSNRVTKRFLESVVPLTSVVASPVLDLHSPRSVSNKALIPVETENNRHGDHAPLKMKIMKSSNVSAGKKLSCVLTTSLTSDSDSLEDKQINSNSLNRTDSPSARLSSSLNRQHQISQVHHAMQRGAVWQAKGVPTKQFSVPVAFTTESPRTARKTIRPSTLQHTRPAPYRTVDPDLGHCDIVYIDKPITECYKEQRNLIPRRNARKSTRGHLYSDEIWELKTVRTLAGRGNCLNPMPELITLVTPKQSLSKPEGVPPVDMPFAGACRETISEGIPSEKSDESMVPGTGEMVEVAASEVQTLVVVETSQTDQVQSKLETPLPIMNSVTENTVTDHTTYNTNDEPLQLDQDEPSDVKKVSASEESVAHATFEVEKENEPETENNESTGQVMSETAVEKSEKISTQKAESQISSDKIQSSEVLPLNASTPSSINHAENQESEKDMGDERPQEPQQGIVSEETGKSKNSGSTEDPVLSELEGPTAVVESVVPVATLEEQDDTYDISLKTLDTLLKELPPWRRKKGSVISLPKRLQQAKTIIVGYVNGRPVSASDRSLRRRVNTSSTSPTKSSVKQSQKIQNQVEFDTTETKNLVKNTTETEIPAESIVNTSDCPLVSSSDIPESPKVEVSPKSKPIQKHKLGQQDEPTENKRQLRSAVQKGDETLSLVPSTVVPSVSPPKPSTTPAPPELPPLCLPPLAESSQPAIPEPPQMNSVQQAPVELNIEETQTIEETPSLPVRQKLRSSNVGGKENKNENQQLYVELTSPMEDKASPKTETPAHETRGKRVLRLEPVTQKANALFSDENFGSSHLNSACGGDNLTRMPLRSESSKAEQCPQPAPQCPPDKKLSLRSQRLSSPSTSALSVSGKNTEVALLPRTPPEKIMKTQMKVPTLPTALSASPVMGPRHQPRKQTNKFLEALTRGENQHLLTNLNLKYDKMQKGWLQMDRDGQTAAKYKNKADRQAAIWKSKRRARKQKSLEHQKCSPVQMLFMKDFNLSSICRWFLESTETKSLIIVKKVNTRLPSETQLCFHSSSSGSGASQGVFPSLQAERLKKHLKKFAITSPVKSNPKSQKLIAKALEQEMTSVKGKERREPPSAAHMFNQSDVCVNARGHCEPQKAPGKPKNPASARILRKYSNIREKMQVQQTNVRLKSISKSLKANSLKRFPTESVSQSTFKPPVKAPKIPRPVPKPTKASNMGRRKTFARKRVMKHRATKALNVSRVTRCSQRLSSVVSLSKSKADKKTSEVEKDGEKVAKSKVNAGKCQINVSPDRREIKEAPEAALQSVDVKPLSVPDQVLTRSQSKMEAVAKRRKLAKEKAALKSARKVENMSKKVAVKRSCSTMLSRTRSQELLATPAKRTRTSR
ncbi:uncharacterized protein wu:fc17b08 isoform X1 [Phycodurus eques]|uniref:uncharacterized protein wu:fc17b08 isoform X1 n=2 Tax=Phycodurus eques TaxID=693459 RepID=UPI002ACD9065|nr:uncharacterized protein wu:fc17b08 isoform X1 [Phycodurus eques]